VPTSSAYCSWCGNRLAHEQPGHPTCDRRRELDPPRYCARCGRTLDVQVFPTGVAISCRGCDGVHPARRPGRGPALPP